MGIYVCEWVCFMERVHCKILCHFNFSLCDYINGSKDGDITISFSFRYSVYFSFFVDGVISRWCREILSLLLSTGLNVCIYQMFGRHKVFLQFFFLHFGHHHTFSFYCSIRWNIVWFHFLYAADGTIHRQNSLWET